MKLHQATGSEGSRLAYVGQEFTFSGWGWKLLELWTDLPTSRSGKDANATKSPTRFSC